MHYIHFFSNFILLERWRNQFIPILALDILWTEVVFIDSGSKKGFETRKKSKPFQTRNPKTEKKSKLFLDPKFKTRKKLKQFSDTN